VRITYTYFTINYWIYLINGRNESPSLGWQSLHTTCPSLPTLTFHIQKLYVSPLHEQSGNCRDISFQHFWFKICSGHEHKAINMYDGVFCVH